MLLIKSRLKFWNYRLAIITFHRVNLSIRHTAQGHVPSPDSFSSLIKIESNYNTISVLNIILYFEYKMKRTMKKTHSNFMHHTFFECLVFYTLYLNGDTNHNFRCFCSPLSTSFGNTFRCSLLSWQETFKKHICEPDFSFHFISFHFISFHFTAVTHLLGCFLNYA